MNTGNIVLTGMCLIILVSALTAGEANNDEKQKEAWGPKVAGCRLSVTVDQMSYHVSAPISLQITIKNGGKERVSITRSDWMLVYDFDFRLPNGDPVPMTLEGRRQESIAGMTSVAKALEPGGVESDTIPILNRLYDMSLTGEYTLTVKRRFYPAGAECWKDDWEEVTSNTIKIVIREEMEKKEQMEPESEKQ